MERVTVLIATYNDEDYIQSSVKSAFDQNYKGPLTICVVSDGSTDNTYTIAKKFFKSPIEEQDCLYEEGLGKNKNIKYILTEKTNGGPSDARNYGISKTISETDIYAILDADDEMYPNKVSECVSVMSKDMSSIGVVYADYDTYHTETKKKIREFKEPFSRRRLVQECIVHSGSLINARALSSVEEETGYYDREMRTCEDYDLWMRISEKYMISHVPKSLTLIRVTGDNSSFIVNQDVWQKNWKRVMTKMQDRLNGSSLQ